MLNSQRKNSYQEFVDKFKQKKTTDDCMTPVPVYDAVRDYVSSHYQVEGLVIDRPFWPGADYQNKAESYGSNVLVLDNPPFSKLSKVISYYLEHNIKFFLFMPALTGLSCIKKFMDQVTMLIGTSIVYENGAKVPTNFVTNLTTEPLVVSNQALIKALKQASPKKPGKVKNIYPSQLLSSAELFRKGQAGCDFNISNSAKFVNKVDALYSDKLEKYRIFGGALLVDKEKASELRDAGLCPEDKTRWLLIPKDLNKADKQDLNKEDKQD